MGWLFDDLRQMCLDLIDAPETKEEKAWLRAEKSKRKLEEARLQKEHAAHLKEQRKAEKLALKTAKMSLGDVAEEDAGEAKH